MSPARARERIRDTFRKSTAMRRLVLYAITNPVVGAVRLLEMSVPSENTSQRGEKCIATSLTAGSSTRTPAMPVRCHLNLVPE